MERVDFLLYIIIVVLYNIYLFRAFLFVLVHSDFFVIILYTTAFDLKNDKENIFVLICLLWHSKMPDKICVNVEYLLQKIAMLEYL